jgi:Carbohydrate/starch-binding module (family 21)
MKKVIFMVIANLFLLSCSQNEEPISTSVAPTNTRSTSKLAVIQNVKLIEAKDSRTISCSRGGCKTLQYREYIVEVDDLAFNKTVVIHQQLGNGQWEDLDLSYSFTTATGSEIWKGTSEKNTFNYSVPSPNLYGEKLAVKYMANGQTYWDNNNSADYTIVNSNRQDNSSFIYMSSEFNILNASLNRGLTALYFDGVSSNVIVAADVRNIAFAKDVKIVYTTNNWETSQTESLTFKSYENNNATSEFETWSAYFSLPKTNKLTYALSYTVNGHTYWDNNFGKNYTLTSSN